MIYIGIDPGLSGAVAALDAKGRLLGVWDTPVQEIQKGKKRQRVYLPYRMADILKELGKKYFKLRLQVSLEYVRAMPGQGVHSMFSIGQGLGLWEGIIAGLELPMDHVTPVVWKKAMLTGMPKGKHSSIVRAQEIILGACEHLKLMKHEGRAEAMLIAEYVRRRHQKG